jgi:hypothetical protein
MFVFAGSLMSPYKATEARLAPEFTTPYLDSRSQKINTATLSISLSFEHYGVTLLMF